MDAEWIRRTIRHLYGDGPVDLHPAKALHEISNPADPNWVTLFENKIKAVTGSDYIVSTSSGTAALHLALLVAGVKPGDKVITSPLTFVATCNAIRYCGADPVFVDIEWQSLGMEPERLERMISGGEYSACIPVHVFGHSPRMDAIAIICERHGVPLIEDSCQAIGSLYRGRHAGTWGKAGVLSFNWNKTVTSGGGGAVITNDREFAERVRHLANVAKVGEVFTHDGVGFNYRLSSLNAALGCGQIDDLPQILSNKRSTAELYQEHIPSMVYQPNYCLSNYWLNTVQLDDQWEARQLVDFLAADTIQARPAWRLMHQLPMYSGCKRGDLSCAEDIAPRLVSLPSGVRW